VHKYLVTGGAGFIGSNIVKALLARGDKVRVLDNYSTGKRANLFPFRNNTDLQIIEADLRSSHSVRKAVDGVEYILHQGALPSVPRSVRDPITTNDVNILGTLNILQAAREYAVKRVVYASSSSIYGNNENMPKSEDMPVQPISPYALTKYAGERYCQLFYQLYGVETVCLRYFNVFGPNQDSSSQYSAVIPKFIKMMKRGEAPVINGDGNQSRDFTYVENNVRANLLACVAPNVAGEVFNIACGANYTVLGLVDILNNLLGTHVEPVFGPKQAGDVRHSLASIDKARRMLGYEPAVGFEEGLALTIRSL
jgi:UDP-glucose 4-epimerase